MDAKKFWDKSAEKYVKSPIKDEKTYKKKLAITQEYLSPDSYILEFGCGSGGTSIFHAANVQHVVATDISEKMIDVARQKAREAGVDNISFQVGVLDELDLEASGFDAVLGLNVLHLIPDIDQTIHRVYSILKDEGVFVTSTSLMGEVSIVFRWLIWLMQRLGLAPFVNSMTREQLVAKLENAGFLVEREWMSSRESIFIVAKK